MRIEYGGGVELVEPNFPQNPNFLLSSVQKVRRPDFKDQLQGVQFENRIE